MGSHDRDHTPTAIDKLYSQAHEWSVLLYEHIQNLITLSINTNFWMAYRVLWKKWGRFDNAPIVNHTHDHQRRWEHYVSTFGRFTKNHYLIWLVHLIRISEGHCVYWLVPFCTLCPSGWCFINSPEKIKEKYCVTLCYMVF